MCDLYTFKHPQCDHHDSAIDAQVHKTCIHQFTSPHVEQVGTIDAPRSSAGDVHSFTRDGQGNSSKRSPWVLKEIPKLGLDAAAFLGAITSGEEAWKALRERSGQRCVWLSKVDGSGVTDYLEGTGVSLADVDEADFILNGGTAAIRTQDCMWPVDCEETGNLEPYTELFKLAISRGLPMICANPDFRSPAKPGKRQEYCAGYVAQHYEELGGVVQYFGKPHSPHFEAARRFLGDVAACHVGDSMIHDVAGARAAALPVVFVAGGIEHQELGIEPGQTPTPDALLRLAERYGIQPDHVVPLAMWN